MAFAIIETGSKQYKVSEGDVVSVEILPGKEVGGKVVFDRVLALGTGSDMKVGTPTVSGAVVEGTLEEAGKADKVVVIKYKAKSRYFKKRGHRQPFHSVKITKVA